MGSSHPRNHKKLELDSEQELQYYTDVLDPHLGLVSIYTSNKFHLCYILKYIHRGTDTKIFNLFRNIENSQLAHLLNLYGYFVQRQTCCSTVCSQSVVSYWEYYNFYFDQYLQRREIQGLALIDSQIWHIVQVCCEVYQVFRKFGVYYEITPETFVITPEGKLKAFWCHLKSHNHHMKYFQYFQHGNRISKFAYSPEQLSFMHEKQIYIYKSQRTTRIDFDKCNSFRLGILLLRCLSLVDPLSNCYNASMTAVNGGAIRGLILNKVQPVYSAELVGLLKDLLSLNPQKRLTPAQVIQRHNDKFSPDFELRVCGVGANDEINLGGNQDSREQQFFKKIHDISQTKTIKFRSSNRNV